MERWTDAVTREAKNIQIIGQEEPTIEEGFLVLTLIDARRYGEGGAGEYGVKKFNVTHAIQEVANRQRNRAEYFSTNLEGDKIGVSLEWRKEPEEK